MQYKVRSGLRNGNGNSEKNLLATALPHCPVTSWASLQLQCAVAAVTRDSLTRYLVLSFYASSVPNIGNFCHKDLVNWIPTLSYMAIKTRCSEPFPAQLSISRNLYLQSLLEETKTGLPSPRLSTKAIPNSDRSSTLMQIASPCTHCKYQSGNQATRPLKGSGKASRTPLVQLQISKKSGYNYWQVTTNMTTATCMPAQPLSKQLGHLLNCISILGW